MDIHHIRYFLAVCETRNFTRAAERCNVTQPALSRAIQQLEDEVGGLLFRRERNLTHITDLGALLRPRFQQIVDELTGVRQEASQFLCLDDAHLKVGVMCTIGPRRFTGLLTDFNRRHSGIRLQLIEGVPDKLSALLEAGELDVAIMSTSGTFPERFDFTCLFHERFVLAVPPGHQLARYDAIPISAINGEVYLKAYQLRVRRLSYRALRGPGRDNAFILFKRTRRLDPEHGSRWARDLLHPGVQRRDPRTSGTPSGGTTGRPASLPGYGRRAALLAAVLTFVNAVKSYAWAEGNHPHAQQRSAA